MFAKFTCKVVTRETSAEIITNDVKLKSEFNPLTLLSLNRE